VAQVHDGFVAIQLRIGDGTVTISKDNVDEIKTDLLGLGLSETEVADVIKKYGEGFLKAINQGPVDPQDGINNVSKPVDQGGLGGKPMIEQGPLCGHGVPRVLRDGKNGKFWSCQAKDEKGTFLWKKKEGCAILDYQDGLKQMGK